MHAPQGERIREKWLNSSSDTPIFSVSRLYYIQPITQKHVDVPGKPQRHGYLFAPSYASKQPFYYWHVNYDAPAKMNYVNTESMNGLTTYHYEAFFSADQTANLTDLPGVPNQRGILTKVHLQLWIEPISGWLVQYQDNSIASFYDKKTRHLLYPWNQFSNRYTVNSTEKKVKEATYLKWKYLGIDFGVPTLIVLLCGLILFYTIVFQKIDRIFTIVFRGYTHYKKAVYRVAIGMIFGFAIIGNGYYFLNIRHQNRQYLIGITEWNPGNQIQLDIQGFKDSLAESGFIEGKNVRYITKSFKTNVLKEIELMQSFVKEKVNLIFTTTMPGAIIAKGVTEQIPIVFANVSYPVAAGIINPHSVRTNLVGVLNYIPAAIQFYYFDRVYPNVKKLAFVYHIADPDSEIQYKEYQRLLNERHLLVMGIPAIDLADLEEQLTKQWQRQHFDALFVACDTLMQAGGGALVAAFAQKYKIPSFTCDQESVKQGILLGYFADPYAVGKLAGIEAAFILQGAKPQWLQTTTTEKRELMINRLTAKRLGININYEESEMVKIKD